jgi:hypothetical protein
MKSRESDQQQKECWSLPTFQLGNSPKRLAMPVLISPLLAHIPSLRRAKQDGRVYHFELRSGKHRLRLPVFF